MNVSRFQSLDLRIRPGGTLLGSPKTLGGEVQAEERFEISIFGAKNKTWGRPHVPPRRDPSSTLTSSILGGAAGPTKMLSARLEGARPRKSEQTAPRVRRGEEGEDGGRMGRVMG